MATTINKSDYKPAVRMFGDLQVGDMFEYANNLFIKTRAVSVASEGMAVDLGNGASVRFISTNEVWDVEVAINYHRK